MSSRWKPSSSESPYSGFIDFSLTASRSEPSSGTMPNPPHHTDAMTYVTTRLAHHLLSIRLHRSSLLPDAVLAW